MDTEGNCTSEVKAEVFGGHYEGWHNLLNTVSQDVKEKTIADSFIPGEAGIINKLSFKNLDTGKEPLTIMIKVEGENCVEIINNMMIFNTLVDVDKNLIRYTTRKLPLNFSDYIDESNFDYTYTIPENYKIKSIPNTFTLNSDAYTVSITYTSDASFINIQTYIKHNKKVILPEEYQQFRDDLTLLDKESRFRVVLEKK